MTVKDLLGSQPAKKSQPGAAGQQQAPRPDSKPS